MKSGINNKGVAISGIFLSVFLTISPLFARASGECELVVEPVWIEGNEVLNLLKQDPFRKAFDIYIRDLEQNQQTQRVLERKVEQFIANACTPVMSQVETHENMVRNHNSRCENMPPEVWNQRNCQSTYDATITSKNLLDSKLAEMRTIEGQLNAESEVNENAQKHAIERARSVLGSINTENAFRLYASKLSRNVFQQRTTDSCHAMAELYEALAQRLGENTSAYTGILERTFSVEANPVMAARTRFSLLESQPRGQLRFNTTGFKRDFFVADWDNQVRHFTFYYVQASRFLGSISKAYSFYADQMQGQPSDYRLTKEALRMAERFSNSPTGIGSAIQRELCM